jgi:hypothetical protein
MALDLWSTSDIKNVIRCVAAASMDAGGSDEYRRGHSAALAALALAFGIATTAPTTPRPVWYTRLDQQRKELTE